MPRYLGLGIYNEAGKQALASHPQDRLAVLSGLLEQLGGKLVSGEFTLGEYDVVVICELPDDVAMATAALAAQKAGHLRKVTFTRLLSREEMMQAMERASGIQYQAPRPA